MEVSKLYEVVFKNISGSRSHGCITRTSFESKEDFVRWYDEKMQGWYEVVDQGVSPERALELCTTPEANIAATAYQQRMAGDIALGQMERIIAVLHGEGAMFDVSDFLPEG